MASPTYTVLVRLVSEYVGSEKAAGIVDRQLPRCNATPDSLAKPDVAQIIGPLIAASSLYVAAEPARQDLARRLKLFAGVA